MGFQTDTRILKDGLIIFRRADVKHKMWYCRMAIPKDRRQDNNRYKTVCLKTTDEAAASKAAFTQEMELHFKVKHERPMFNRTFSHVAKEFSDFQKTAPMWGKSASTVGGSWILISVPNSIAMSATSK